MAAGATAAALDRLVSLGLLADRVGEGMWLHPEIRRAIRPADRRAREVAVVDALDAELVVLSEPFLGRIAPESVQDLAVPLESLGGGPKLALQLTFCDARVALESGLAELPVDAIGVDFYLTHLTDLPKGLEKLLLAGVVDARSSTVEDAGEVAGFARRLQEEREVERLALVPNGDLQFVAQPIAADKLRRLGTAKTATVPA
jgi:hypothetical protein